MEDERGRVIKTAAIFAANEETEIKAAHWVCVQLTKEIVTRKLTRWASFYAAGGILSI